MRGRRWRTVLFVPADRPDRIATAHSRGADAIVIDLEDAVAAAEKERVRDALVNLLAHDTPRGPLVVRVNSCDTPWFADDVAALSPVLDSLDAVMLPKAAGPEDVRALASLLDAVEGLGAGHGRVQIMPVIETAVGVLDARPIAAASSRTSTMLFGSADLSADLGITASADGAELAPARSLVVLAAAAAGRPPPMDGPHLTLGDDDGLRRAARSAKALGFGGKAVIHPDQIPTVHGVFGVDQTELAWAHQVEAAYRAAEASGRGVARLADGTFIDGPVVKQARAVIAAAHEEAGP